MKRKLVMLVLIFLTALCQCCVFQIFSVASVKPNLLIILTVSFGLMRGRKSGLLTGFFSGLCIDLFFPGTIGFQTLIYMWTGYLAGFSYRIFYDDDIKTPILLAAAADFAYGTVQYAATFLLRGRVHFLFYLSRIIIPEVLYTILVTLVFYRLLYALNRYLTKSDKRSINSFV